jgi:hypothetical protein
MIGVAMVLAFVGLVLLAPVHPGATSAYFDTFDEKFSQGLSLVLATALVSPNLAAGLILFPAMGTCLSVSGSAVGLGGSFCVLSWTQFPGGGINAQTGLDFPSPLAGYFLYLLVPLIAVLVGGAMAVRRGRAATQEQAVTMGVLAGVVFGLLSLLLAFLVTITFRAQGGELGGFVRGRIGPELFPGSLWPFLWGIVGGAIGAFVASRKLPRAVRTSPPALPTTPAPPETEPAV